MDNFVGTTKQFAEKVNVSYQEAQGLITFLAAKGLAVKKGEEKKPGGKGKPSTIWEIPNTVTVFSDNQEVEAVIINKENNKCV